MPAANLGPCLQPLLANAPWCELGAGQPVATARPVLERLAADREWPGVAGVDEAARQACLAGLWLRFNYLDESHELSQSLQTPTGSYWHAIMHRREGDFGNSKYWLRQTGRHEINETLASAARQTVDEYRLTGRTLPERAKFMSHDAWDPYRFVDLCESAVNGQVDLVELCRGVQHQEWTQLFESALLSER